MCSTATLQTNEYREENSAELFNSFSPLKYSSYFTSPFQTVTGLRSLGIYFDQSYFTYSADVWSDSSKTTMLWDI